MTDFEVGRFVTARIHQLIGSNPGFPSSYGRAMLAQLRQAESSEPGTAPAVWAITLEGIPEALPPVRRERVEQAVHTALTQFAVHQQSRGTSMHDPKQPFGRAIRKLATSINREEPHDTPVYARFTAMSTATTLPGLLAHSRGLISQLRSADIAFDYGRYARDLHWFLTPGGAKDVHRRWGRDFHHFIATSESTEGVSL